MRRRKDMVFGDLEFNFEGKAVLCRATQDESISRYRLVPSMPEIQSEFLPFDFIYSFF